MTRTRLAWGVAAAFWAVFGLVTGIQIWIGMLNHHHFAPLLIGYYVVVWEVWLLPTALIHRLAGRFPAIPFRGRNALVHFVAANVVGVLHIGYWIVLMLAVRPFDWRTARWPDVGVADTLRSHMPLEWILYCLILGVSTAWRYYERSAKLEASLADARLHALELQLQPHFLFNTLNSISSLVRSRRNDEAVQMMAGLSELLRYTLDHEGEQQVPLEDELAVLRRYLEIQHARFPDRMSFDIDLSPDARRGAIPTLLLQPLAENAVRHGIAPSSGPGVVHVRAYRREGRLLIEVFNSGALEPPRRGGIGLRNTRERLRHLYGDEGRLELASTGRGVLASVSIPWKEVA